MNTYAKILPSNDVTAAAATEDPVTSFSSLLDSNRSKYNISKISNNFTLSIYIDREIPPIKGTTTFSPTALIEIHSPKLLPLIGKFESRKVAPSKH
jgi:hypothetical protein